MRNALMTVLTAALVGCSGEPTGPTGLTEEEEGPRLTDFCVAFSDLPAGGLVTLHAEAAWYHPVLVNVELVRGLRLFEIAMTRIH
jgi:hypothetical protein